ncbi:MAG: sigma-54 dependent transcriptional regulator [Lentisphaeria bacterium]|nr:sigma-54 dependent transcriptional regulator [Lentisphaeria bacterium]
MKEKILIIDDERNTREGLKRALKSKYDVQLADNGKMGLEMIFEGAYDLILTDLKMPGLDGMELLKRISAMEKPPTTIMLTAYGSIDTAIEAVHAGAESFLEKPVDLDKLEITINKALGTRKLSEENTQLKRDLAEQFAFEKVIGKAPNMVEVMDTVRQVAPVKTTVLLTGENGTGKEVFARALHQLSNRANKPFVAIHCAALSENLLESELFGHEKGAFTGAMERKVGRFEAADGGTVFLDEIGEIDASTQVKLLRVLESRRFERVGGSDSVQVDIRLIAATNQNLKAMVAEGTFREDLYYRLDVLNIHIPALRERREDIPLLLAHYLKEFCEENGTDQKELSADVVHILEQYSWPGNVRQLKNVVERMVVLSRNELITEKDIPVDIREEVAGSPIIRQNPEGGLDIESNERYLIEQALEECKGNRTNAAQKLGISRRTLHRKLHHYGIQ